MPDIVSPDHALRVNSHLLRIFISIASYRDPECQHTVRDAFLKAKHPERIFAGICWQTVPEEDQDCFQVDAPYPQQVRTKRYHASESKGGCWARVEALSLLQDEHFVLQIDAHMRFVQDWDKIMIETFLRCPAWKTVLSTMPPNYDPPDKLQPCDGVPTTYVGKLGTKEELPPVWLAGWLRSRSSVPPGPLPSAFICGNFTFAPSLAFKEVPFDPHIYFRGQEPAYSARLWTHGWDIYQPDHVVIYHYWESKPRGGSPYKGANETAWLSKQRVMHLLGIELAKDERALVDIKKYGLGTVRRIDEFWKFAGVNLKTGTMEDKARHGMWTAYVPPDTFSLSVSLRTQGNMDMKTGMTVMPESLKNQS